MCFTEWKVVGGALMQIDSRPKGVVCGVKKAMEMYCRFDITDALAIGTSWEKIADSLKYIFCEAYGYWGVNQNNEIYFTALIRGANTKRTKIDGSLTQVEAGPNGQVWGVNVNEELYKSVLTIWIQMAEGWK